MTIADQREAARKFINSWRNKGYEKGDTQPFWIALLHNVLGLGNTTEKITFEKPVTVNGQTKFIDAYIEDTKVLIEQKSDGKDLNKPVTQSGGIQMTPYEQARRYAQFLPYDEIPRWIVTCNFKEFHIHDMKKPNDEPEILLLDNLQSEYYRLDFLVDKKSENISKQTEVSIQAGEIVGLLYDALLKQYKDPTLDSSAKSLNALCVRLVFCLYSEDAGIFGRRGMFHDYLTRFEARDLRRALQDLFHVLDTKPEDRDPYLDDALAEFPYVDGELFSEQYTEIPMLTDKIRDLILNRASASFDWSDISPTIFGAVFESTLNPQTRRSGGMHYTSIENIHKVIGPLFLDGLRAELEAIKEVAVAKTKREKLDAFQEKLASLAWLDPACGSGNFLTESYISIRRLENEVIKLKVDLEKKQVSGQIVFGHAGHEGSPIKVSIGQFHGIEINDFAVTVAKAALWIAESQMMKETEDVVHMNLDFLPLESYSTIVEGNALQMDWNEVIEQSRLSYIMGNPPFVGYSNQTTEQKKDILSVYLDTNGKPFKAAGKIDYVAAWYYKAAQFISGTQIRAAFVSTNSITQGEQVAAVWKPLFEMFDIQVDFAYRTFVWNNEAKGQAAVHCVIIGFSTGSGRDKKIYDGDEKIVAKNISPYLVDAPTVFVESRSTALCIVPPMVYGNKPTDGGNLFIGADEYEDFLSREPLAKKYVKKILGATEYINNVDRYCLWLVNAEPADLKKMPLVRERIENVRKFRLASPKKATRDSAATPTLFQEVRQSSSDYIIVPCHSSENRRYIPLGFVSADIIVNNAVLTIPDATLYNFGILTSNVHMAWVRAVCGRIKSDYRYSKDIVYNNFPWPEAIDEQKALIETLAQKILDVRLNYPKSSLADLYDPFTMPPELLKAHRNLDRAVMKLYGFSIKDTSEASCVAALMEKYTELTKP